MPTLFALGGIAWLVLLGCRVGNEIAQVDATPTRTPVRATVRPTFTAAPPTLPPTDVPPLPPTIAPPQVIPTRRVAPRPAPTRTATAAPPPTPAPPPTADPYQGYFYRISKSTCVSSPGPNTVIVGTVYERGVKVNGITVRVSAVPSGPPSISDFVTGVDPFDSKHQDASLQGQYRLGLAEGGYLEGNWSVFVINSLGDQMSPNASLHTDGKSGCNLATVDFAYQ
jgi:hypothetical protein